MKTKKKMVIGFIVTLVTILILLCAFLKLMPKKFFTGTGSGNISKIVVFNGNTGKETVITDKEAINYIVGNIKEKTFKRTEFSFTRMGYNFRMSFYDEKGKVVEAFVLNSKERLNSRFFEYRPKDGELCFDYVEKLVD